MFASAMYKTIEQLKEMDWYSAVYTARNDEVQAEYGNRSSPRSSLFSFSFFFLFLLFADLFCSLCSKRCGLLYVLRYIYIPLGKIYRQISLQSSGDLPQGFGRRESLPVRRGPGNSGQLER